MNPVYIRMTLYTLAAMAAAIGFGTFDAEAGTLTLDLNQIGLALGGAGLVNGAIFAAFGKK